MERERVPRRTKCEHGISQQAMTSSWARWASIPRTHRTHNTKSEQNEARKKIRRIPKWTIHKKFLQEQYLDACTPYAFQVFIWEGILEQILFSCVVCDVNKKKVTILRRYNRNACTSPLLAPL